MKRSHSDTFLARWLNNELTPSELREFEKSSDFLLYKKIAEKSLEFSTPDFNKKGVFAQIQTKVASKKKGRVRSLVTRLSYVAAASVVLTFAILFFNDATQDLGILSDGALKLMSRYETPAKQLQIQTPKSAPDRKDAGRCP